MADVTASDYRGYEHVDACPLCTSPERVVVDREAGSCAAEDAGTDMCRVPANERTPFSINWLLAGAATAFALDILSPDGSVPTEQVARRGSSST